MKKANIFLTLALILILFTAPYTAFAQNGADKTSPSDVNVLKGVPGDSYISLEWEKATDNINTAGYKVYYGTNSITNENDLKYDKTIDVGNVLKYIIGGLENGKTYYFAVTAYDAANNESEYFSPEVSSMPMSGLSAALTGLPQNQGEKATTEDESKILKIEKAEAVDNITVKITFSAPVIIPETNPENSFVVQDNNTVEPLKVNKAALDAKDKDSKTALLTTDIQIPGTTYIVTINDLKGKNNEAVSSGKNDTALFEGSDKEHVEETPPAENKKLEEGQTNEEKHGAPVETGKTEETLQLKSVALTDETTLTVIFNKKVILSVNPVANFEIAEKDNPANALAISAIKLEDDKTTVTLVIAKPEGKTYLLTVKGVIDENGQLIDENANKLEFSPADKTPPEDAANFVAMVENLIAKLSWISSVDTAKDLIEQILYKSMNQGKTYSKLKSLDKSATSYNVKGLIPGKEYQFKLTQKDKVGNESAGAAVTVIVPKLPATGPGGLIALLIGAVGAGIIRGNRKKS